MERASTRTDAELIRAAADDADAFAELYDRYARDAVAWARRGGVHEPDVVDVVAELFAQAWRSRRRFRDPGDGGAGAWLHGISRHLIALLPDSALRSRLPVALAAEALDADGKVVARSSTPSGG